MTDMVERVARALAQADGVQICDGATYALSSYRGPALAAIAAMQADAAPVAWMYERGSERKVYVEQSQAALACGYIETPLYAHPPVADRVSTSSPVDDREPENTSDKLRDAVEVYLAAGAAYWGTDTSETDAIGLKLAAAVIEQDRAELVAENERLRRALGKNAARFERCADMIADGGNPSGILRLERFLQAKQYATEARAALAGESHD